MIIAAIKLCFLLAVAQSEEFNYQNTPPSVAKGTSVAACTHLCFCNTMKGFEYSTNASRLSNIDLTSIHNCLLAIAHCI